MRIEMTGIMVNDPHEAIKFYTTVLGFVEVMYVPDADLAIVASPEEPDGTNLLLEHIASEYERLKKLGVRFSAKPTKQDFGIQAIFDDTCGNYIMLVELNEGNWESSSGEND